MTVRLALALFFYHIFLLAADAGVMTFDDETEVHSSDTQHLQNRNILSSLDTDSSKTGRQADLSACKQAEQMYKAAAEDARILERAIFLSAFRREVERALNRRMTNEELRALADEARADAHRWYKVIQSDPRCAASWHGQLNSPRLDRGRIGVAFTPEHLTPLEESVRMPLR